MGEGRGGRTGLHRGENIIGQHRSHTVAKDAHLHEKKKKQQTIFLLNMKQHTHHMFDVALSLMRLLSGRSDILRNRTRI